MRRGLVIGGSVLAAVLIAVIAGTVRAEQTPRIRAGGEGEIAPPKLLKRVEPAYPEEAKSNGIQGTVALEVVVSTEGDVIETEVKKSVPLLDEAAVAAVSQWKYTPTLLNGQPVEVILTVTVRFVLN
jgi:protein TonB